MKTKGTLFVISASSGAGKTTLVDATIKKMAYSYPLEKIITYTSRAPRAQEVHGKDYYFLASKDFEARQAAGFFLESSNAYGTYYGSPKSILEQLESGISCIIILDMQGALAIKQLYARVILIWVSVSIEMLKARLEHRAANTPEQIAQRIQLAQEEQKNNDALRAYNYSIINDDFSRAVTDLVAIITEEIVR